MRWSLTSFISVSSLLLLSGCLDVPHPFRDPGREARTLAGNPPPSRLDVPVPDEKALGAGGSALWASDIVEALLQQSVPAIKQPVRPGDWWLKLHTERRGDLIVPLYTVMTPKGAVRATQEGPGILVAAWNALNADGLREASAYGAGQVVNVLNGIQAEQMEEDPHSLKHRGARIWFRGVTGAPGDGNTSLAQAFVVSFHEMKDTIQTSQQDSDFAVTGVVKLKAGPAGSRNNPQQNIEINWRVTDKADKEVGIATQLHDIPAHSLDGMWGDVAIAASQEAAGAVEEMITRYTIRDVKPLPDAKGVPASGAVKAGATGGRG
ncbi:hypothetical protein [Acetobacter fallax]|uniref:Lipoprotein n=1 Tax=Acetobacter fallax TaxID=1737473 RepID=A0ABX0K857_9PROT|nr:hypothetical protein [Acetobacter fallax]NHO31604.1 hypothetical protein [Acetobacter fallax]NHO35163.1 hypothetical protein [Acetobacter fallax]